jgi:hypothetical protein
LGLASVRCPVLIAAGAAFHSSPKKIEAFCGTLAATNSAGRGIHALRFTWKLRRWPAVRERASDQARDIERGGAQKPPHLTQAHRSVRTGRGPARSPGRAARCPGLRQVRDYSASRGRKFPGGNPSQSASIRSARQRFAEVRPTRSTPPRYALLRSSTLKLAPTRG